MHQESILQAPARQVPVVVVVDDDDQIRRALGRLLGAHGYATRGYGSAEALLAEPPVVAACLVLDIDLGGMSGLALYAALRQRGEAPPALFISGSSDPSHRRAVQALGDVDLLMKPFDGDALIAALRRAMGS